MVKANDLSPFTVNLSLLFFSVEMTPDDTQELYKENIKMIIDRWRETNALRDPDVDWVSTFDLIAQSAMRILCNEDCISKRKENCFLRDSKSVNLRRCIASITSP